MALSVIIKKKSNFSGNLLEIGNKKVQNAKHIPTLVMTHTNVPVITKEQSSFISSPSVRTAKEIGEKG